jgi:hypothetical protein
VVAAAVVDELRSVARARDGEQAGVPDPFAGERRERRRRTGRSRRRSGNGQRDERRADGEAAQ